jgi:hypothetical protein
MTIGGRLHMTRSGAHHRHCRRRPPHLPYITLLLAGLAAPHALAAPAPDANAASLASIEPITPQRGGPLLVRGVNADPSDDAAGETQLFEQVFVAGATDYPVPVQGLAIVDMDRDGRPDLFLSQDRPRLLLNRGGFHFEEHALDFGGAVTGSQSPTFADFNGDGFPDLYLSGIGPRRGSNLFLSQGVFDRFRDAAEAMGVVNRGCYCRGQVSVADIDRDGWLDFAIAANAIGTGGENGGRPLSRMYVYRPAADGVFEKGRFEDIGGTAAIPGFGGVSPTEPDPERDINGMSSMLRDWDDDGDLDFIRVGHNDMLRGDPTNRFATGHSPYGVFAWRNRLREDGTLRFEPIPPGTPGALSERGKAHWDAAKGHYVHDSKAIAGETVMSADTDNDGDLDVLITGVMGPTVMVHSLWLSARFWRNEGGLRFADAIDGSGLDALNWWAGDWHAFWTWAPPPERLPATAFSPRGEEPRPKGNQRFRLEDHKLYLGNGVFGDFDNDGWIDYVQVTRFGGMPGTNENWRSILFRNLGDGRFEPVKTEVSGINEQGLSGRAVDLDGDGRLEFVLMRRQERQPYNPAMVFWNSGRQFGADANRWLGVRLAGRPERQLLGASIFALDAGERRLVGRRDYLSTTMRGSQPPDAHFGLGQRRQVDVLVVLPDGQARLYRDQQAGQLVTLDVAAGEARGDAYARGDLLSFVRSVAAGR